MGDLFSEVQNDVVVSGVKNLSNGFLSLMNYQLRFRTFAGSMSDEVNREVCDRAAAAAVLPYDRVKDELVLVEQFRVGVYAAGEHPWILETVAGILGNGEMPEEVAVREAEEESGCSIETLLPIASFFTTPGSFSEKVYLFCGLTTFSHRGGLFGLAEEGEDIKAHILPAASAIDLLDRGKVNNATTIIALQWLKDYRRQQGIK